MYIKARDDRVIGLKLFGCREIFHVFLSSAEIQNHLFKTNLSETLSECQTDWIYFVGPDLDPNCLQRSSADDKNCRWQVSVVYVILCRPF